ncbi:MAG: putative ATP-dependent helicase [Prokaryotic dsDNA virus sp.]|nr:MAG: putative ATP-dependent helicase [Prokaryotic dsDNA virus sp.]
MSEFLRHEPCPRCGSKDNLARYTDNHAYCFGCDYYEHGDGTPVEKKETHKVTGLIDYEVAPLHKRGISEDTCKKFDYGIGTYEGRPVQIANYRDGSGNLVAQKLRFVDKTFKWLGDPKKASLFGSHLWRESGKMVTITEGELDALSVSQVFNLTWPVVSIPNGAKSAARVIAQNIDWLESFDSVVLCFDQDTQGRAAALEAAQQLSPGKAKIVTGMPLKDANDCVVDGKVKELIDAVYSAKSFRPDGVVPGEELWDVITDDTQVPSIPYPWPSLNDKLFGMRGGELVTLTAGTGIGKSSVARELAYYLMDMNQKVGYIALEESVKKTSEFIMGLRMNVPPHLWTQQGVTMEQKKEAFDATVGSGNMVLYDHWGSIDPANLLTRVRYMARAMQCKYVFLDHLSIVVSALESGDERRTIDNTMTKLRSLVEETNIHLVLVSHLRRPDGRSHEEGGSTSLSQLRGSHAIAQLSDAVIGCERDQQDESTSRMMALRVLKNRYAGDTGMATVLEYSGDTGRLSEWIAPEVVEVPAT